MTLAAETNTAARSLVLDRLVPAPISRVWAAWSDPEILPRWWGPRGFTCKTKEINLRSGGLWRFDMIAPDGTVFANRHRYHRHDREVHIAYLLDDDGGSMTPAEVDVSFNAVEGGTYVTLKMVFASPEILAEVKSFGAASHGYTTLDCLTESVMGDNTLSISRLLTAPPARVWAAWTDVQALRKWCYPDGIILSAIHADIRPGGSHRFEMASQEGGDPYIAAGRYVELIPNERLVLSYGWEDDTGEVDVQMVLTVTLTPHDGGTRLILMQTGLPSAESRDSHAEGWTQTLNRLPPYLESQT